MKVSKTIETRVKISRAELLKLMKGARVPRGAELEITFSGEDDDTVIGVEFVWSEEG